MRQPIVPAVFVLTLVAMLGGCAHERLYDRAALERTSDASLRGKKIFTLDDLYDPDKKLDFSGRAPAGLIWLDDERFLWPKSDPKSKAPQWVEVNATSGASTAFTGTAKSVAAFAAIEGVTPEKARRLAHQDPDVFARASKLSIATIEDDVYAYTLGAESVVRVTQTPQAEEEAAASPDGHMVAFVRDSDLYVATLAPVAERRITRDGGKLVLNGKLDWLYQEEIYGRGTFRAHWWSEDSRHVAFLRLDEALVPEYTLVDDTAGIHAIEVETSPYPRPGEPNPTVKLGVARASDGNVAWVDLTAYADIEFLIVDVAWSPSGELAFQVQDREQRWLDLVLADPETGATKVLFRETSPTWVNVNGSPSWLDDGSFLWLSERTGFKHIEHCAADGSQRRALTSGAWEVRTLHGVDEAAGLVYFSGTERSPIGGDTYRVPLAGGTIERLTREEGSHSAKFSPSFRHFIDTWSDIATPTRVEMCRADGSRVFTVGAAEIDALDGYALSTPEFLQVKTRDGFPMEAMLIRPVPFDPTRRYPVFQHTYAGPHAQQVRNVWLGTNGMFFQMLAQRGIVVWVCDNRTASGKGTQSEWPAHLALGESELADIEDGIAWLAAQPWVDATRIGISGWSYGGFMAAYALTHGKAFAMGIAGGPVTHWGNYDSIYTERFMRTPKNNPEGYARTSVLAAAKDLSGELLLIHGAIDDNVHPQNTMLFVDALQKAGKSFELMLYPGARHGVVQPAQAKHLRQTMLSFIERTLLAPKAEAIAP